MLLTLSKLSNYYYDYSDVVDDKLPSFSDAEI